MRKAILFFCVALMCSSCGPRAIEGTLNVWNIGNGTSQTLILKCPFTETLYSDGPYVYKEFLLEPNARINVCSGHSNANLFYDFYSRTSAERYGEDVYWQVMSEDGVVLKTWRYSDRDLPDQRFFEESSWYFHHNWEWMVSDHWSFAILPEDIEPTE